MKIVLNAGSGESREMYGEMFRHGWVKERLDVNPGAKPDIVGDVREIPVEGERYDAVYCSHVLEHLWEGDEGKALGEFYRVLKVGGFVFVRCPDMERAAEAVLRKGLLGVAYISPSGPIRPMDLIYGLKPKKNPCMGHRSGFTAKLLRNYLYLAGFERVRVWKGEPYDLLGVGRKESRI